MKRLVMLSVLVAIGATFSIGYRHQNRRTFFRLGAASTSTRAGGHGWRPMLGISGGGAF